MKKEIFRIIDANLNRSREGLRVCEDISRFVLNSPAITSDLKAARHKITDIVKILTSKTKNMVFESRDAENDIGRCSGLGSEMKRRDLQDIFTANIERVKESIRVLEELLKLVDKKLSARCSSLRFRVYDIEKKAVRKAASLRKFR